MRRFRPDALLLVVILTGGYLAYSAPRPASKDSPVGAPVEQGTPSVRTGAPEVYDPMRDLAASASPSLPGVTGEATVGAPPANRLLTDAELAPTPSAQPAAGTGAHATALLARQIATVAPRKAQRAVIALPAASDRPRRPSTGPGVQYGIRLTWYCSPPVSRCTAGYPASGAYGAISPDLAGWRGRLVRACYSGQCVVLRIIDCTCQAEHSVDAYASVFRQLAPLSVGTLTVTLELVG